VSSPALDRLGPAELDALREVGNIGAGNAATSLSTMIGRPVGMRVPAARVVPLESVADAVGGPEAVVVSMYLQVVGEAPGHIVFVLPPGSARDLCDLVLAGMPAGEPDGDGFTAMELSALSEIGNILTSSYLCALGDLTGLRLEPSPPAVGLDMAGALLSPPLAEAAMTGDVALVIETAFEADGAAADGFFLYIPTPDALGRVLAGLGLGA
jgi:chemotaxis protein CheC